MRRDNGGATCEGIALPPPPTPPHKGEGSPPSMRDGYALAFACAMKARQPPKLETSRAPSVGQRAAAATRATPTGAALIFPAWIWSWGGVLLRRSRYLRAPVPPESRSWPFPARPGGDVPIWCRRPNANTLARTRGSPWEMLPWRAPHGEQAGARPVSQPPAPARELPVMNVDIPRSRPLR